MVGVVEAIPLVLLVAAGCSGRLYGRRAVALFRLAASVVFVSPAVYLRSLSTHFLRSFLVFVVLVVLFSPLPSLPGVDELALWCWCCCRW